MYFAKYYRDNVRNNKWKMQFRREATYFRKYGKLRPKFPKQTGGMVTPPPSDLYKN